MRLPDCFCFRATGRYLTIGQKCPTSGEERRLDKRDRFLAELRDSAKARGLAFKAEKARGKGGHALVWVGPRWTTIPSRDIDPKTARKIRKALGL
jgi:hypothetical protein